MAKKILGIDIGHDSLKMALVKGNEVKKVASVDMPKNLVREGRVVSVETMGELLRTAMRENHIHCSRAAFVLSNETVYVRNVTMPMMTADQLVYNLPYEFNDYITDEPKNYVFDYAMLSTPEEVLAQEEEPKTMELMAVAVPIAVVEEARDILRKAGLKMVKAAPVVSAYVSLIRAKAQRDGGGLKEYCILDLGYNAIRMYMFQGDRHMVTRVLETGFAALDQAVAEAYNVDIHLAHTYLLTDYDGCQTKEFCMNAYNSIAVELMRAMNFYHFSNPESQLNDVWICGGGAVIEPLRQAVQSTLDVAVHPAEDLLPASKRIEKGHRFAQAIGIAME